MSLRSASITQNAGTSERIFTLGVDTHIDDKHSWGTADFGSLFDYPVNDGLAIGVWKFELAVFHA